MKRVRSRAPSPLMAGLLVMMAVGISDLAQAKSVGDLRRVEDINPEAATAVVPDREALHAARSEEHTSELQSLKSHSYAVHRYKNKQNLIITRTTDINNS